MFTRQAWEGSIEAAIDEAARHNSIAGDWVLGNTGASHVGTDTNAQSPEALRAALRALYFADYAEHWQTFMNSLRCDAAPTLPAAMADTLAYAQFIAASLGEQWAAMGAELFVRPVSQATPTVLEPAQASLNDAWQDTVVATWNKSFAGRYPFANTANDASLPELAELHAANGRGQGAAGTAGVARLCVTFARLREARDAGQQRQDDRWTAAPAQGRHRGGQESRDRIARRTRCALAIRRDHAPRKRVFIAPTLICANRLNEQSKHAHLSLCSPIC